VSKYLINKFLYTVDRDPELTERYRDDPRGTVAWWEAERANVILGCHEAERSTWLALADPEREALATHELTHRVAQDLLLGGFLQPHDQQPTNRLV